jgi:hypothetical protein
MLPADILPPVILPIADMFRSVMFCAITTSNSSKTTITLGGKDGLSCNGEMLERNPGNYICSNCGEIQRQNLWSRLLEIQRRYEKEKDELN